ncbi:glycosyltransferase family 61 protein [Paenibacillus sp. NPDC056579]|uniref:glycosyltransferase family 61 protein n=1 Tax=Paenibacillus sp. NPDC056579 TaxID=3345871 RepID=UPI0036C86F97
MMDSSKRIPPSRYYESTLEWINHTQNENRLHTLYPEIPIPSVMKEEEWQLLVDKPRFSNKAFVADIPDGRVLGDRAVISPDNVLLWDVSVEWAKLAPEHSIFQDTMLPPVIETDKTVAMLNHPASKNYYHWLMESIARIHLLQLTGIPIDKYIINHQSFPFQLKTLAACGIPMEKIVRPNDRFHLSARRLIVPSYVNLPNAWSCQYVRNTFLPYMASDTMGLTFERIYIRRKHYRKIVNEDAIFGLLSQCGFISIELEALPLEQQIRLFYNAKIIVAAHGAGLANLVFCQPETHVIELFPPSFMEPHYWMLSRLMGLDYHMIVGTRENPNNFWSGFDNLSIDPRRLLEVLSCL